MFCSTLKSPDATNESKTNVLFLLSAVANKVGATAMDIDRYAGTVISLILFAYNGPTSICLLLMHIMRVIGDVCVAAVGAIRSALTYTTVGYLIFGHIENNIMFFCNISMQEMAGAAARGVKVA